MCFEILRYKGYELLNYVQCVKFKYVDETPGLDLVHILTC